MESELSAPSAKSAIELKLPSAPAQPPPHGELVEQRDAWLPQEARELFTERSRLLQNDPYLLHAPVNTQRGRRADWALFCAFCESRGRPAMPASPNTVVAFLETVHASPPLPGGRPRLEQVSAASLARRVRRAQAAASGPQVGRRCRARATQRAAKTLEHYISTVATAHRLAEQPDPTRTGRVRNALKALMSSLRAPQPRAPLRRPQLLALVDSLYPAQASPSHAGVNATGSPGNLRFPQRGWRGASVRAAQLWDLRARALLACLYPTMVRRSELVELRYEDLPRAASDGAVPVYARKTRQHDHRFLDALAVRCLKEWCQAAGITNGPLFRELDVRGHVGELAMDPQQVAHIARAVLAYARDRPEMLKPLGKTSAPEWPVVNDIGAHSTRIGAAHDLVAAGQDLLAIMHSGGWKDPRMPRKYIQELQAQDSGMARMLKRRLSGDHRSLPSVRSRPRAGGVISRRKGKRAALPPASPRRGPKGLRVRRDRKRASRGVRAP